MDYDGNDTHDHNTSKSPSVLRPYDFPRFDIDDSLQGHLRFDSLVETDVFLDIQSQDDNQWIEDFSRESDVINFSSTATESCSIARQNNVWSEATSSESVEMLLKSVGLEQIPPKDTVSENSNTCNVLRTLTKEMEPKFEQDNVNGESTRISSATMLQDELLNNVSGLENRVEGKLSQVEETSLSQEKLVQAHESASQMCQNDLKEECKLPVAEGVLPPGTECDDKDIQGAECPVDLCLDQTGDGLSCSATSAGPAQDINDSFSIMVPSRSPDQKSSHSEGADAVTRATNDGIKEQQMVHADTRIMEQHKLEDALHTEVPHSTSSAKHVDEITADEVITNESSMKSPAQECQFELLEGRGRDNSLKSPTLPGRGQTDILSTNRVLRAVSTVSDSLTDDSEQHATKLSNPTVENCSSSEANMDSAELNQKLSSDEVDHLTESSHQEGGQGNLVLGSYSQSSLIKGENESSIDKISNANIVDLGESSVGPVSSSSVGLTKETDGDESIKDLHDASAVNMEGSRSSGYREDFQVEADQQSNARGSEDISVETKKEENTSLSTCVIDSSPGTSVAPTSDPGSSAMMRHMSHDEPIVNQQHSENAGEMGTANAIPCKNNDSTVEGNNEDIHKRVSCAVDSTSEVKSGIHHDSTAPSPSGTDGELIPVSESCDIASGSEFPTLNSGDYSKRSQVHPDCDDSVLNKDPLKLECNSPTIISSVVLLPDEIKQKGDGGSELAENKPSASENPKGKDASLDDNSFTFKVNLPLNAEREKANTWTPFLIAETYKSSKVLEGVSTPDTDKIQARLVQETSGNIPGDHTHGISKATSGRKRRGSGKGVAKENLQKGVIIKETTPDRPSHKEEKTSVSLSPGGSLPGQLMGSQPHGLTKHKSKKLSSKIAVPTSKLPDLNASALKNNSAPSTAFHQPFTELQQVQLRAQIFVYGSLIQGTVPDEACMISAFGSSDGGRGVWEPVWQAAVERDRSKKSKPGGESPLNSHSSGAKVPDLTAKQVSPETKAVPSSVSRASNKGTSTANLSPIIPLSSPLWSISTPYHDVSLSSNLQKRPVLHYQPAISPRQPYHSPPVQNIIGHTARQSQAPSPSLWVSQTSALHVNARFSTTAITETVKLTPVKDFPFMAPSYVKPIPAPTLVYTDTTSTVSSRSSQLPDQIKGSLLSEVPASADSKSRRRKKNQPSAITAQNPLQSQAQTERIVASSLPTLTSPLALVASHTGHVATSMRDVFPACSTSQPQVGNLDAGKASSCSVETLQKVEDARLQAEEAAAFAATAISHCQSLWSQLAKQDSRMAQEAEAQIASAAGAAAAAASVAKAAAAAARVASNAALQAKLMADEAFISTAAGDVAQSRNQVYIVQSVGSATPLSILTSDGGTNQSSPILVGVKEAAKGKIQAASAAAKQAENLDSILEAAKLAAEAVFQAGKVVAMGEPLPLKELISLGPEWYWKLPQASSELVIKSGNVNGEQTNMGSAQVAEIAHKECGGPPGGKILDHGRILMENPSNDSFISNTRNARSISEFISVDDNDPGGGNNLKVSDVVQSNRGLSVLESSSRTIKVQNQHELGTDHGSSIKEGSVVEVYKDGDGLKPAWFLANVLTLHDGKALIQYTSLLSKEGSGNLKEWVALEGEGDKAPRIRASLPMTASHSQGSRKRRRSALGNYAWIVGDMVDVWIQNSWYEGIVTEKNEKDDTTLTVHFPARGETSAVSTQQLRFSRIWTDGNWVQCSRLRGHDCRNESDMPIEKRPRLKSPSEKNKSEGAEPVVVKPEESKLQALSGSDMVFNVGKNSKADTKPDACRTLKTGLQREGSRVVFGVPKPGRKRKFVEVSKHFPANQNAKNNESKDQVKFAKYLMPHRTDSCGGKNLSKVDSKEKQSLRNTSLRPRSSSSRMVPQRGNLVNPTSSQNDEAMPLSGLDVEKSADHEDTSKTAAMTDRGSSSAYEAGKGPLGSSLKKSSSSNKPDLLNKGKLAPAGGKLTKVDEKNVYNDKTDSIQAELSEPRRSNRRVQPTHRLLEGLQSSLIIPKMTSVSLDKGQPQKSRSTTSALSKGK